ncbi:hypothetical protein ES703_103033 [subsurface metagenome]
MTCNGEVLTSIILLLVMSDTFDLLNRRSELEPDLFLFFPWRIASFECVGTEVLSSLEAPKSVLSKAIVRIVTFNIRVSHNCFIS